jgi:predicted TIM-barrel fold metal-dependent hydrolase
MTDERICLASADGHVGPPTLVYRDYLEPWEQPLFDEYYAKHIWRWSPQSEDSFFPPETNAKFWDTEGFDPERGTALAWDPELRLKAMDQAMIPCDVFFPDDQSTNDPPWGSGLASAAVIGETGSPKYARELVRAGARAYNRWLAEFCSVDPARLRGMTILGTLDDVLWCCQEVRRAYDAGLQTGVMLPLEYYLPALHHPRYEPLWRTCSELNLPVASHIATGHPDYLGEDPLVIRFMYGEGDFFAKRPISQLILGGVLERFPNLRLVITELGVGWLPMTLAGLDAAFEMWPDMRASREVPRKVNFSMKPSEYWQRQCFIAHTTAQRTHEFEGEFYDSVPNMVFGADIGHFEGWWPVFGFPNAPKGQPAIFADLPVLPVEQTYKAIWGGLEAKRILPYLEDNFFRLYQNVDRKALQPVVDRIGPTPAEIGLV